MKAHRRQELKENDLAHWLKETAKNVQENSSKILLAGAVVIVVIVVGLIFMQSRQQARAAAWERLSKLSLVDYEGIRRSLPELESLAADASGDALGLTVLSKWGEVALRAVSMSADDAEKAEANEQAGTAFQELRTSFADNPLALGVALCGLATVEENRFVLTGDASCRGRAKAYLEQVRDDDRLNGTPFKEQALNRLNALDETFTVVKFAPPLPPVEEPSVEGPPHEPSEEPPAPQSGDEPTVEPAVEPTDAEAGAGETPEQDPKGEGAESVPPKDDGTGEAAAQEPDDS